jgi:hypothetical protein
MKSTSKQTVKTTEAISFVCHQGIIDEHATFQLQGKDIHKNNTGVVYKADGTMYIKQETVFEGNTLSELRDTDKTKPRDPLRFDAMSYPLDLDYNLF